MYVIAFLFFSILAVLVIHFTRMGVETRYGSAVTWFLCLVSVVVIGVLMFSSGGPTNSRACETGLPVRFSDC